MITQNLDLLKIIPSSFDCSQQTINNGDVMQMAMNLLHLKTTVVLTSLLCHLGKREGNNMKEAHCFSLVKGMSCQMGVRMFTPKYNYLIIN